MMKRITNEKHRLSVLDLKKYPRLKYGVKLWLRLAAIEDIISDENGEYDLDRLQSAYVERITLRDEVAELVKAKRDGRCVVLPCKIGGKLYSAFPLCGVNSHQIRKFEINKDGMFACSALMIPFSDVGKTVFLTREAAEEALKEYKDGQKNS